jgi:hypothetical protein
LRPHVEAYPINLSHRRNRRKTPQTTKSKIRPKIPPKITKKEKHDSTRKVMIHSKSIAILIQIKSLQDVKTGTTSSHSLEDWRDLSHPLLTSLTP